MLGREVIERKHRVSLAIADSIAIMRLGEPLERVLTDRLEHPVSNSHAALLGEHERLLDQCREQVEHRVAIELLAGADLFAKVEREPTHEHAQTTEQKSLGLGEKVVAPINRGA